MEKLIQLLHAASEEMGALAWLALGFLLPVCIIVCLIALHWIRRGRLVRTHREFFAEQREIAHALRTPQK